MGGAEPRVRSIAGKAQIPKVPLASRWPPWELAGLGRASLDEGIGAVLELGPRAASDRSVS